MGRQSDSLVEIFEDDVLKRYLYEDFTTLNTENARYD